MPTTLTNGIQLPDKGSVDWYSSMQSNYNLIDTHLGDTNSHVTTEDKARWDGKANASHTHTSSELTDIGDYATKQYVDTSISGLVDNAPDALNTLNELSAALNDDSNFASTVTTALAAKANSADLATVATSGSYTDLTDKPTIPTNTSDLANDSDFVVSSNLATVATSGDYDDLSNKPTINDSTITIQKNGSTVDTFTTNGSAKTINITVPTKTSDLTNDSNFVDTSNSAVASGITSAKVTSYDGHIADTDIHVTFADKTNWNKGVLQAYVTRYTNTAVSDNSTVAYSDLNNTDNIKIGDFILDVNGKLYQISSVDTANETVSVTTPLTQLAVDSNVVHKSGNETVDGQKTLVNLLPLKGEFLGTEASNNGRTLLYFIANRDTQNQSGIFLTKFRQNKPQGGMSGNDIAYLSFDCLENSVRTNNGLRINFLNFVDDIPQRFILWSGITERLLGTAGAPWSDVSTDKINALNPGSLSLPDLNNGIDISGFLDVSQSSINTYTPVVDGWISIKGRAGANLGMVIIQGDMAQIGYNLIDFNGSDKVSFCSLPVKAGVQVEIWLKGVITIDSAKFFPCQGNV